MLLAVDNFYRHNVFLTVFLIAKDSIISILPLEKMAGR
jgi:hypothetical protein